MRQHLCLCPTYGGGSRVEFSYGKSLVVLLQVHDFIFEIVQKHLEMTVASQNEPFAL